MPQRLPPALRHRRGHLAAALAVVALLAWLAGWWVEGRREHRFDGLIREAAQRHGVDPALVKAVIWRESHFHPGARGRAGELGLMQVTDAAAQEWAESAGVYPLPEDHLLDPRTNVLAGSWYLAKLLRRYAATDDPTAFALADYNAGRGNVLKWARGAAATNHLRFREAIGFPTTRAYVAAVLERQDRYRTEFR